MSTRDAERLEAGLAADERVAEACAEFDPFACEDVKGLHQTTKRALADVAAKRRILALYEMFCAEARAGRISAAFAVEALEPVIAALAAVYEDAGEEVR